MKNNLVNRAISALTEAGFDVLKFSRKGWGPLKLKVIPNSVEPGELGCEKHEVVTITRTTMRDRDPG